jgi:anti-sigma factor RsiW
MSSNNFTSQEIVAFVLGELDSVRAGELTAAAAHDGMLSKRVNEAAALVTSLRQGVLEDAPAALRRKAMGLWKSTPAMSVTEWLGAIAESALERVFDSRQTPMLAGFRGGSESRHVMYAGETIEVDVVIEESGDVRTLRGQVSLSGGEDCTDAVEAVAVCAPDGSVISRSTVDGDGMFVLSVGMESCDLAIRTEQAAYRLKDVL